MANDRNVVEADISFYSFIRTLNQVVRLLFSRWKIILLGSFLLAGVGFAVALFKKPHYTARTTLMLEEGNLKGGGLANYLQLAGQLGLMSGGMVVSEDKVMEILKSRNIIVAALMRPALVNGKKELMANHYINVFDIRGELDENGRTKDFLFKDAEKGGAGFIADSLLNEFVEDLSERYITVGKHSKSGIITLEVETPSELFSKHLCEYMVESVSDYYISNITQKERETVDIIQSRVDSITGALRSAETRYARLKDASNRLIKVQGFVEEYNLRREIEVLSVAYAEGVKNLELSKFNLLLNTPVIQVIDKPVVPLEKQETSPMVAILGGAFLGGFITSIWILTGKVIRTALRH